MLIYMSSQQHFQGVHENLPVIKMFFFKTDPHRAANNPLVINNRIKNRGLAYEAESTRSFRPDQGKDGRDSLARPMECYKSSNLLAGSTRFVEQALAIKAPRVHVFDPFVVDLVGGGDLTL